MAYQNVVLKILFCELGQIAVMEIFFLLTFALSRHVPEVRRYTYILGAMGLVGVWVYRYDFRDVVNYLQKGDAYIQASVCRVDTITSTTLGRLLSKGFGYLLPKLRA